jgi:pyruvate dehydrogenase E2 component (dihydrolipoamide acetyltransferase)
MEEAAFSNWLKKDGEPVSPGDPLFVLEADKALQEVESLDSGILHIPGDAPKPGATVRVGQVLGYLLTSTEAAAGMHAPDEDAGTQNEPSAPVGNSFERANETRDPVRPRGRDMNQAEAAVAPRLLRISPRARRAAENLGVDPAEIEGTGRDGRIRERDVQRAAETRRPRATPREEAN